MIPSDTSGEGAPAPRSLPTKRRARALGPPRRAQCPACGRVARWYGETFTSHRRSNPNRRRVENFLPGHPGMLVAHPPAECEGSGQTIEERHLRG